MQTQTVTKNALIKRLNRKLYPDDRVVRKARGVAANWKSDPYYIIDWRRNLVVMQNLTLQKLESMAREERCLAEWENVAEDGVAA
jgi:hypothetical protein